MLAIFLPSNKSQIKAFLIHMLDIWTDALRSQILTEIR